MPRMDGLTFLRKLMKHYPLPVVVVSTLTTRGSEKALEALAAGAVEVVAKDMAEDKINDVMLEIVRKVRAAAGATVKRKAIGAGSELRTAGPRPLARISGPPRGRVVAIGSSTGGTEALARILRRLPPQTPGIVIVQHMPPAFTPQLAARLDQLSQLTVREARGGDVIEPGPNEPNFR